MILAPSAASAIIRLMSEEKTKSESSADLGAESPAEPKPGPEKHPKEIGGPPGPEPTRYGDWQYKGRVTDF
ncbi:MAG TPA: DUF1674 domain-containing protein [Acetobacteraceae bacterium]|nr:DUF1674 domain-containing protein [Acetobacteraceae bacterium]